MKKYLKKCFSTDLNEARRFIWLKETISKIPAGYRILDAGAGQLRNKSICAHLDYVSQDFCQYEGVGDGQGLQTGNWDTSKVDFVCDITAIPEPPASFDVILCSEVLEHLPDPLGALAEFTRLLKSDGKLILTAPFASLVHFAPYHYCSGFSRYWYEYHLPIRGFEIKELTSNGDWFTLLRQEMLRLGGAARKYGLWTWPLAYGIGVLGAIYLGTRGKTSSCDLACFGWHCVAVKK